MGAEGRWGKRGRCVLAALVCGAVMASHAAESADGVPPGEDEAGGPVVLSALDPAGGAGVPRVTAPAAQTDVAEGRQAETKASADPADTATAAAVADGITTAVSLSAGAVEMNPLVPTSPLGVVALTGLKVGLVKYAETLPEEEKRSVMKTTSAVWMGAAVNNILIIAGAANPVAVLFGIVAGILTWQHVDGKYEEQDRLLAANQAGQDAVQSAAQVSQAEPPASVQSDAEVVN